MYNETVSRSTPSEPVAQDKATGGSAPHAGGAICKGDVRVFLQAMDLPLQLVAILPDKGKVRVFRATNAEELTVAWRNAKSLNSCEWNIYYELNIGSRLNEKGELARNNEASITHLRGVAGDVDAKDGVTMEGCEAAVDALPLQPSSTIRTGGGLQPIYLFDEIVEATEENRAKARAAAEGLAALLGGDSTVSLEHLFRVPGFMNWPNKKKRDAGREPVKATIREAAGLTYSLDDLFEAFGKHAAVVLPSALAHSNPDLNSDLTGGMEESRPFDALSPEDKDACLAEVLQVPEVIALAHAKRREWLKGVAACARSGAPGAFELCRKWSKLSEKKYAESDFYVAYASFAKDTRENGTSIGTLINIAKAGGWIPPWLRAEQVGVEATAVAGDGGAVCIRVRQYLKTYRAEPEEEFLEQFWAEVHAEAPVAYC